MVQQNTPITPTRKNVSIIVVHVVTETKETLD